MHAQAEGEVRQAPAAAGAGGSSLRPACSGSRSPLRRLHGMQQVTMFSQSLRPPRATGTTWSKVSCEGGSRLPQYWQVCSSRA